MDVIHIHDFCSGPRFIAIKTIIEKEKERKFNLTVSDIDGSSLLSLLNERKKCNYDNIKQYEVRYQDLCLPLKINGDQMNKYHLVSINLGLHQLPMEEIYAAIRYFGKITKIGGLIANLDASERRYLQLMIIPGNLIDREGHVPDIEKMDLNKLIIPSLNYDYLRIVYPLVNLSKRALINLDPNIGIGPYMVSFYSPFIIQRKDFNLINELWKLKQYDDCNKLIMCAQKGS